MNEHQHSSNIRLGAFVAAGLLLLVATLYYMGQKRSMFGQTITVTATFRHVKGLLKGNLVQYNGITVGTVKRVELQSPTSIKVYMAIEREFSQFIPANATAQIGTEGLMGNKIVNLLAGSTNAPPVQEAAVLTERKATEVDSILSTLDQTSGYALVLAKNLAAITAELQHGKGPVQRLLTDSIMAEQLALTFNQLNRTSHRTMAVVQELSELTANIKQGKGAAGMVLADTAVRNQLAEIIHQFNVTSKQTTRLSEELLAITDKLSNGDGIANRLLTDTAFANDVGASLNEIREGTEKFNETMAALQHNFLVRRYFRKKNQQQQLQQQPEHRKTAVQLGN